MYFQKDVRMIRQSMLHIRHKYNTEHSTANGEFVSGSGDGGGKKPAVAKKPKKVIPEWARDGTALVMSPQGEYRENHRQFRPGDQVYLASGGGAKIISATGDLEDIPRSTAPTTSKPTTPKEPEAVSSGESSAKPKDWDTMSDAAKADFLQNHYDSWAKGLSRNQSDAIKAYTGGAHADLNSLARGEISPKDISAEDQKIFQGAFDDINSALHAVKTPFDLELTRGITDNGFSTEDFWEAIQKNEGQEFTDPAFGSTTSNGMNNSGSFSFAGSPEDIAVTIHLPKGSPGAFVRTLSQHPHENEFLLPKDSTFYVNKVETDPNTGQRKITLTYKNKQTKALKLPTITKHTKKVQPGKFDWAASSFQWKDKTIRDHWNSIEGEK